MTKHVAIVCGTLLSLLAACGGGHEQPTPRPSSVQAIETDAAGEATVTASSKKTQRVAAASGSAVAGASLEIPPGALAVDLGITLQEGESLAAFASTVPEAASLGITAAGPAVLVSPSVSVETLSPFTLALPLPATALQLNRGNLAVAYITTAVKDGVTSNLWGLIPPSALEVGATTVKVKTTRFGSFQVVRTASPLTAAAETSITTPPIPKATSEAKHWGLWRSECIAEKTSTGSVFWMRTWANLGRDKIEFREEQFSDEACSKSYLTSAATASYKLSGDSAVVQGASNLDGVFQQLTLTLLDESAISLFNATQVCGYSDWTVKVAKDIAGRSCDQKTGEVQPKVGDAVYTLLEVQTSAAGVDQLRLGKNDGPTPETRSIELEGADKAMSRVR